MQIGGQVLDRAKVPSVTNRIGIRLIWVILTLAILASCGGDEPIEEPTPTLEPKPTVSPTQQIPTAIPTLLPTSTPVPTPVPTSEPTHTPIPLSETLTLLILTPDNNIVVDSPQIMVTGMSSPDDTVSVDSQIALIDESGHFSTAVPTVLKPGTNAIEIIASDLEGTVLYHILTVIYIP